MLECGDVLLSLTPAYQLRLNSTAVARCYAITRVAAVLLFLLGAIGIIGWFRNDPDLKALFTGPITMKANAAICLMIAGGILLLQMEDLRRPRWLRTLCTLLSLLLFLIGALTCLEHLTGINLYIDELFFTEAPGSPATASPGRMGPPGALSFALAGLALLFQGLSRHRARRSAELIALLIGVIALVPLIGYAYGIKPLYGLSTYTGIALNTASALAIMALAILLARPREGLMAIVCADDAGGLMARRLIVPAILLPFALGLLRTYTEEVGWIDESFGRPMMIMLLIVSFVAVIWRSARSMGVLSRAQMQSEEARRQSAERLRLAIEAGRLAPWEYHSDRNEFWLSAEFASLLGRLPREQICPLHVCIEHVHTDDRHKVEDLLRTALERRHPYRVEYRVMVTADRVRWISSRGDVMLDDNGNVLGMVGIAHDITARKQAEEALAEAMQTAEKAREAAESANNAKDHFLASLSHELRTPLSPVLTTSQMLEKRTDLSAEAREQIAMIRRNVQLETRLIDDLLDLTRISRGKLALETAPAELHTIVEHVMDICRNDIDCKQMAVELRLKAGRTIVHADTPRLQQILWNLLKNAVKFTPAGGRIVIETLNLDENRIEVRVIDSGLGIDPENLSKIFNAFEQGGSEITRQFGGLGLGLAISKALADLHGGKLSARSDGRGRGSTFILNLPLAARQVLTPSGHHEDQALDLRGLRILLVEDHADTGQAMCRLLRGFGCQVESASNVRAGLELAVNQAFDLILSDLGLPDGTGYDLIRQVLERRQVRAIALSGYGMEEDQRRSRDAGFVAHLTKPVDQTALVRAIQTAMAVKS